VTADLSTALRSVENIPRKGPLKPQISPLRCTSVEMTKGRAALPATAVAGKVFFITLGGPTAFSGRDDKREGRYGPQRKFRVE
jgi:hypothetical protein